MADKLLIIGIIQQQNSTDVLDNMNRIADKIGSLASSGAQLIVNQELHDSLYFCQVEDVNNCKRGAICMVQ